MFRAMLWGFPSLFALIITYAVLNNPFALLTDPLAQKRLNGLPVASGAIPADSPRPRPLPTALISSVGSTAPPRSTDAAFSAEFVALQYPLKTTTSPLISADIFLHCNTAPPR